MFKQYSVFKTQCADLQFAINTPMQAQHASSSLIGSNTFQRRCLMPSATCGWLPHQSLPATWQNGEHSSQQPLKSSQIVGKYIILSSAPPKNSRACWCTRFFQAAFWNSEGSFSSLEISMRYHEVNICTSNNVCTILKNCPCFQRVCQLNLTRILTIVIMANLGGSVTIT